MRFARRLLPIALCAALAAPGLATAAAQKAAQKLVGRTVTAGGANCQAALDAAIKDANEQLCRDYLDLTSGWSTRLGDRYDELTDHGKRSRPDVEEAIRQSFELEPREPPETRGRLP